MHDFLDALYDVIKFYVWVTGILAAILICYYFVSPYQNCKRDIVTAYYELTDTNILSCSKFTSF